MSDPTEGIRKVLVDHINSNVESSDKAQERARLEAIHGEVWDTQQLQEKFIVEGFMAPFCVVTRKDGVRGSVMFQHHPRFYFRFEPDKKG